MNGSTRLYYNRIMNNKKRFRNGLIAILLLSSCASDLDRLVEEHGKVTYNNCFEDGSCRMEFQDGYFVTACVRPHLGCE